ncbi:hypothetical protein, conserved [Trypanosoma brucei brucei TREU927]|uniref:ribonuclease P n=1 Tax=Trypanosoma brucei brucei (strain 927/4 GUTat10.1) TaxID=185431 RepID=Q386L0_TRYB2|nr:hypothetical protein, conserved [Trypanosoma brucei brucei TREU927]EAN79271.1 hypothetical protein, conserved [Trypanosoma brucei brucei TREU927]
MRSVLNGFAAFSRFVPVPTLARASIQCRWKSIRPVEELQRRVGQLVGAGDVRGVVDEIRMGLSQSVFSMKAFANALFLLERTKNEDTAMDLVKQVQESGLVGLWDDESVLAVILRLQCAAGDAAGATKMFSYMVSHQLLRLRSVSVFLSFWCKRRDRRMAFAVYEEALRQRMDLSMEDYLAIGRLCVNIGEPLATLHCLLREMQGHADGVSAAVAEEVIRPWALRGGMEVTDVTFPHSDAMLPAGTCCSCSSVLSGHRFTALQKSKLLSDVVQIAMDGGRKNSPRARMAFETWRRFISSHGHSIDVLVDGANLGYYGLSSWYALAKRELLLRRGRKESDIAPQDVAWSKRRFVDVSVNFELIELAVQEAYRRGMQPLVLLHERHCEPNNVTDVGKALVSRWRREGVLYCTPSGLNDDLCWLYAALELTTPTDAVPREEKGKTVLVLTNDLMRDHHFRLLSPRHFSRWRDRHRIAFKCSRVDDRTLLHWEMPAPYAQCIQELSPLTWHIPISTNQCGGEDDETEHHSAVDSFTDSTSYQFESDRHAERAESGPIHPTQPSPLQVTQPWLCVR